MFILCGLELRDVYPRIKDPRQDPKNFILDQTQKKLTTEEAAGIYI